MLRKMVFEFTSDDHYNQVRKALSLEVHNFEANSDPVELETAADRGLLLASICRDWLRERGRTVAPWSLDQP